MDGVVSSVIHGQQTTDQRVDGGSRTMDHLEIAGRRIGAGQPCFVIAEAGVNHNGRVELARQLIDAAAEAGADAVKFQTFRADGLVTRDAPKAAYQRQATDPEESQWAMIKRLELPFEAFRQLQAHAAARGILFLSTAFDEQSLEFLGELRVPALKVPSGELTNLPLLRRMGAMGLPVIVSTGMSWLGEVSAAVDTLCDAGDPPLALLHCVSQYPADASQVNLRAMDTLAHTFGRCVGYSDHTLGLEIALAAVARGACILEKHFTLDRALPGPDHRASLEPRELAELVRGVRLVGSALGDGAKQPTAAEIDVAAVARKSLIASRDIPAGGTVTRDAVAIRRPGTGLPPAMREAVLGRRATRHIPAGTLLSLEMLA